MTPLKLMSWNIQEGGGEGRLDAIAALIGAQKPDCVALLEVDSLRNADALASELRMALTYGEANCPSAVAWLTVQPPIKAENHRLPQLAKTLLEIELDWDHAPLRLFATHLGSRWDIPQPADEVVTILQVLEHSRRDRHILAGDLNALRPGDPVGTPATGETRSGDAADDAPRLAIRRILEAGYVDCFRHLHPRRRGFTYPSQSAWLRLDYIFASPGLTPYLDGCDVIDTRLACRASDHLPVVASFYRPPPVGGT
jgi:endonuclease/exonuclease/phosphatase family metal-dependent hydrolase